MWKQGKRLSFSFNGKTTWQKANRALNAPFDLVIQLYKMSTFFFRHRKWAGETSYSKVKLISGASQNVLDRIGINVSESCFDCDNDPWFSLKSCCLRLWTKYKPRPKHIRKSKMKTRKKHSFVWHLYELISIYCFHCIRDPDVYFMLQSIIEDNIDLSLRLKSNLFNYLKRPSLNSNRTKPNH